LPLCSVLGTVSLGVQFSASEGNVSYIDWSQRIHGALLQMCGCRNKIPADADVCVGSDIYKAGDKVGKSSVHGIRHTRHFADTNTFINYQVYLTTLIKPQELHYIYTRK
jgi:hypothetical protein